MSDNPSDDTAFSEVAGKVPHPPLEVRCANDHPTSVCLYLWCLLRILDIIRYSTYNAAIHEVLEGMSSMFLTP